MIKIQGIIVKNCMSIILRFVCVEPSLGNLVFQYSLDILASHDAVTIASLDEDVIAPKSSNLISRNGFDDLVEQYPPDLRADHPDPTQIQPYIGVHLAQRDKLSDPRVAAVEQHKPRFPIFH